MFGSNTTILDETLRGRVGGGPGSSRGLPHSDFARVGDLGPTNAICSPEWQIAFLGEIEPRAARPGRNPASGVGRASPWLSTTAGGCKTAGHFRELLALLPRCGMVRTRWPTLAGCHAATMDTQDPADLPDSRKEDGKWMRLRRVSQHVAHHGKGRTCSFCATP